ncbi:uncharacterized protein LOC119649880 [Hermetia illucens]|uniref:uncharacterized protein LOC119649880 n=1 Tax=Hermetia illucens TaxID=343691 RepID=UPI0018CC0BD1|nr:uncharacterized protein LOC119649880 [Hermetia illucens]
MSIGLPTPLQHRFQCYPWVIVKSFSSEPVNKCQSGIFVIIKITQCLDIICTFRYFVPEVSKPIKSFSSLLTVMYFHFNQVKSLL